MPDDSIRQGCSIMNKIASIVRIIKAEWEDCDIIQLWNDYCEKNSCINKRIHKMSEFNDELIYEGSLGSVISPDNENFSTEDKYFGINQSGHIASFNAPSEYEAFRYSLAAEHLIEIGDDHTVKINKDTLRQDLINNYLFIYAYDEVMMGIINEHIDAQGFDFIKDD